MLPTLHSLQWQAEAEAATEALWRSIRNEARAERRRHLYQTDPLWRLSKLKDLKERRLRARMRRAG